ncbi:TIGR03086 family metal-binding protein [Streptomyces sp. NBC_01498]|uniref:TIGR03086 family metal-binding protein n=1 Tax=Streptomyces sp. NBC_01498 TaxID=2975870 RepID=UPI002E7C1250|nr:TIGR03086 family metal-binding protein [Streptomyces sp. NBC_01498]WTL23914.1 TIGR03086 family metal-binding protein [Streptomyces sp. NBC_01498]
MTNHTSSDTTGPIATVHPALRECAAEAARVAGGVPGDRLRDPTPSADWDVRALANHLVLYTSHGLEHRARRTELPEELTARDFTADADWADRYRAALDRAVGAWSDPAVWDGEIGGSPAATVATLMALEMALHGWELARATGQEFRLSDDTAVFVLGVVEEYAGMYRTYEGFAEPVAVPAKAGVFDRALAASGRDPRWTFRG